MAEAATNTDEHLGAHVAADSRDVLNTDVGVFPLDWELKELGEIGQPLAGLTYSPANVSSDGTLVLRSSNVQNGQLAFENNVFVRMAIPDRAIVRKGDILICVRNGSRELIGKCALIDERAAGMAFGAFMGVFRSDLNDFIFYAFQSDYVQRQVREHLGATINQITSKSLKAFKIALPTDPDEISAIAEALNDADAQVVTLKKLIEKKRHIKQGAMQDLLSGRTRLPKFRGEWRIEQLGDLLSCRPEYGINAPAVPYDLRHPAYIRITDITDDGRFDPSSRASVVHPNADCYRLEAGDIVLARTGASTGKSYFYREQDGDLVFAGFLIRVRPDQNQLSPQYLRYQLQTETYWRWVRTNSMRSGQPGINGQQYASMPIAIPPTRAEQNAIAEALADMDAQLEALEARLEKARQVKQGMMQELLTGRVRLV